MDDFILYVKSEKISIFKYSEGVPHHPCTGAYRASQTIRNYTEQDEEAAELLNEAGITHKLIDLSDCSFIKQLKAKITGINETPTLILNGKKIKGIQNIKQALHQIES